MKAGRFGVSRKFRRIASSKIWFEGFIKTQNVNVKIKGVTPLLMHADNIEWADSMDEWNREPGNKATSKAGDDRTPAWRWLGCLNHDSEIVTIPSEYIMRC